MVMKNLMHVTHIFTSRLDGDKDKMIPHTLVHTPFQSLPGRRSGSQNSAGGLRGVMQEVRNVFWVFEAVSSQTWMLVSS